MLQRNHNDKGVKTVAEVVQTSVGAPGGGCLLILLEKVTSDVCSFASGHVHTGHLYPALAFLSF